MKKATKTYATGRKIKAEKCLMNRPHDITRLIETFFRRSMNQHDMSAQFEAAGTTIRTVWSGYKDIQARENDVEHFMRACDDRDKAVAVAIRNGADAAAIAKQFGVPFAAVRFIASRCVGLGYLMHIDVENVFFKRTSTADHEKVNDDIRTLGDQGYSPEEIRHIIGRGVSVTYVTKKLREIRAARRAPKAKPGVQLWNVWG